LLFLSAALLKPFIDDKSCDLSADGLGNGPDGVGGGGGGGGAPPSLDVSIGGGGGGGGGDNEDNGDNGDVGGEFVSWIDKLSIPDMVESDLNELDNEPFLFSCFLLLIPLMLTGLVGANENKI
jgi:hypothetical protein